ncbi:hypothetical protein QVD17_07061 [Tagetes erecta]|uniref:Cytochrome P450 n=1 Tax=Tagetes erecta TaxID=13708 RepID=A0AAD8LKM7_TARER|nr:hypothetical protein QVD17_07061 [Tagetes erecta]
MDYFSTLSFLFPILLALAYTTIVSGRRKSQLPPGPFPLPIIGNLLHLSDNPHQSLATLAKRYGPLMSLRFGTRTSIVVSSPDIAKDFFQTHDHLFSGRPVPDSVRVVDHDNYSLVWLPTGNQWQRLRRISKEYLFSVRRLDASEHIRQQKELFIAGIDTTSSTIEWAMVELIHNPHILEAARNPRLLGAKKMHKSFVMYGQWGVTQKFDIYDPDKFIPERFLEGKIDYKGQSFELIPFGAGRRSCPGINIAHRMLHIILGSLIREFDWKLEENLRAQDMNMEEKFGLTLQRKLPLMAIPLRFK